MTSPGTKSSYPRPPQSLSCSKWCLTSSTLSGGNTKVPPSSVATSPTLPSFSRTSFVPVRAILRTMFCLSFRFKAVSANRDFLSSQTRFSSETLDCFWWRVVCSERWHVSSWQSGSLTIPSPSGGPEGTDREESKDSPARLNVPPSRHLLGAVALLPGVSPVFDRTELFWEKCFPHSPGSQSCLWERFPPGSTLSSSVPSRHLLGAVAVYYRGSPQ